MSRISFRDPVTNVLVASGFVSGNRPGDLPHTEADDFNLTPGQWQWDGTQWIPFVPPLPPPSALAQALDALLAVPTPTVPQIVGILRVWRQSIS